MRPAGVSFPLTRSALEEARRMLCIVAYQMQDRPPMNRVARVGARHATTPQSRKAGSSEGRAMSTRGERPSWWIRI